MLNFKAFEINLIYDKIPRYIYNRLQRILESLTI